MEDWRYPYEDLEAQRRGVETYYKFLSLLFPLVDFLATCAFSRGF